MSVIQTTLLFALGAAAGSFLNVAGLRWRSSLGISGRSFCPVCGRRLKWYELVPILSYIFLRGRCRTCRTRISLQYPLIEIWTGLVFLSVYNLQFAILETLILLAIFSLYILISIYDLRHKIIPDELVYSAIVLSLGFAIWKFVWDLGFGIWDLAAGPAMFAGLAAIWLFSRGRALGLGDAKLGFSIGLLLGAQNGFSALVLAFWIGAAAALLHILISPLLNGGKRLTMKSEVPFAPFMVIGAWASLVYDLNLLQIP